MNYSTADLAALLHSCPIAIYSTDRFGIVQTWSPAAERLSGFSSHEAVGRFDPIVQEDAIQDELERVGLAFAGEVVLNTLLSRRKKDGSTIDLSMSVGPLRDESGEVRGAIFLAVNVTEEILERKKVELLQSEFVSTVSHELRTPLTSIGGALALIAAGAAGAVNDRVAHLIGIANNNTKRLIRLVNDILDIEKLQSGQMVFNFAPLRVDDVITHANSANLAYAATFGIDLRYSGAAPDVVIKGDPDRLQQALTNLISNAVKFSPQDAEVEVCATRMAQGVRISVIDRGPGIPEEFRARIFGRFAQADASDTRPKGGSGLGLSIVREIIDRHGGTVSFDSVLGVGTSFHLDLPEFDTKENTGLSRVSSDTEISRSLARDYIASHDPLTGLANQTLLATRLASTIAAARKGRVQISMSYLMLVDFSEIDQTLGAVNCNAILKNVAARLSELATIERNMLVARLADVEFAILCHGGAAAMDAENLAKIMIPSIAQPISVGGEALIIEPSLGTANFARGDLGDLQPDAAAVELMKRASIALSVARKTGPGTHRIYDESLDHRTRHLMTLRHSLRGAVDRDQFELHYQPVVDLHSGKIVSAEALMRWQHPRLGLLRSDLFISLAEESGLIGPLGEWALESAMRQVKAWQAVGINPPKIALNLSGMQLKAFDFAETVKKALALTGADPRQFELELTESIFMERSPEIRSALAAMKTLGFDVVIDSFGAAQTTFQHLRNLSIDRIKMDRIFVRQLVADSTDAIMVRAIVTLAKTLKIGLVAEGIETIEQRDFLREQGCAIGQGYFFSVPLSAEDFGWMIENDIVLPILPGARSSENAVEAGRAT
jgi:PAS domain S-box-containing protein/diguanylate cyclase (GGDEF)-like protein